MADVSEQFWKLYGVRVTSPLKLALLTRITYKLIGRGPLSTMLSNVVLPGYMKFD